MNISDWPEWFKKKMCEIKWSDLPVRSKMRAVRTLYRREGVLVTSGEIAGWLSS